ncbi:hypothetical protein EXIGLDRAFT_832324 [Exidia glandulosa HHB12029]|uniref:Chitinase n=1 Tax=Exidia glandulosa HHB12029 TaxID=1314781 RepID=A0A165LRQ9_EXIGL|nr:hypothetical protein EXIGLDRAFT_832324 [Exidia glandulosa HHB12029]
MVPSHIWTAAAYASTLMLPVAHSFAQCDSSWASWGRTTRAVLRDTVPSRFSPHEQGSSNTIAPRAAYRFDGHAIIGFFNPGVSGDGYVALPDVSDVYNVLIIHHADADTDPASPTYGGVKLGTCFSPACANGNISEADFITAVKDKTSKGKLVPLGVFWNFGGDNANGTAQAKFIDTVTAIIDKYGFNGLNMNDGGIPTLDNGDDDFANPTTPAVVNFIATLKTIKSKYGDGFGLSFAITSDSFQNSQDVAGYQSHGAYLPVLHAIRDDLSTLILHHFHATDDVLNQAGIKVAQDTTDYWVALVQRPLSGFTVAGKNFPPFRASQIAIGSLLWDSDVVRSSIVTGLKCVMTGEQCGGIRLSGGPFPDFLGAAVSTIEDDEVHNGFFRQTMPPFFQDIAALPPSSTTPTASTSSTSTTSEPSNAPSTSETLGTRHGVANSTLIPAIVVPILVVLVVGLALLFWCRRKSNGSVDDTHWPSMSASGVQRNGDSVEPYWRHASATAAETSSPRKGVAAKTRVDSPTGDIATSSRAPDSGELNRLAALQTEMGRVGLTTEALQASLSRLRLGSQGALTEYTDSDVPPPSYVTRP